jgi:hypothetical protein
VQGVWPSTGVSVARRSAPKNGSRPARTALRDEPAFRQASALKRISGGRLTRQRPWRRHLLIRFLHGLGTWSHRLLRRTDRHRRPPRSTDRGDVHDASRADLARRAIAALERVMLDECSLKRMKADGLPQSFAVVISRPSSVTASFRHELVRTPSIGTVHAPHCPWSHPSLCRSGQACRAGDQEG